MAEVEILEADAPVEEVEGTPEAPSLVSSDHRDRMGPELQAQLDAIGAETPTEPEVPAEQDTPAEPEVPESQVPQWVNDVLTNPRSITTVPRGQQAAVIEAMKVQWTEQANQYGRQMFLQGQQVQQQNALAEARRAEIEAMQEDDPSGFVAWAKENPADAAKFLQGQAPAPAQSITDIRAQGEALSARVHALPPELAATFSANQAKYPATPAGLAAFAADVALAEAQATNPARKQAEQREQAAERVRSAPKADVAGGAPTDGKLTLAKLKTMSAEEIRKYPKDVVDAALKAG